VTGRPNLNESRPSILVVDDEPTILKAVGDRLAREGFSIITATDGEDALEKFQRHRPDLIVLDLMLPKLDGFEVCRVIRERSSTPIIILSVRGDEIDKLVGFRLGVDDYMVKPFSPSELAMRVQAVLRRASRAMGRSRERDELRYAGLVVDRGKRSVTIEGRPVELTAKEFDLLWLLASHPDYVFTREQLLDHIWQSDYEGDLNNVTVLVSRLREKLGEDPSNPLYVRTVWGVGYKFQPPA